MPDDSKPQKDGTIISRMSTFHLRTLLSLFDLKGQHIHTPLTDGRTRLILSCCYILSSFF
jgi:hypothetical protein